MKNTAKNTPKKSQADTNLHVRLEAAEALRLFGDEIAPTQHISFEKTIDMFLDRYCPEMVQLDKQHAQMEVQHGR